MIFIIISLYFFFFQAEDGIRDSSVTGVQMCAFFFQAEDGIRDSSVTGVQTCALPISSTRGVGVTGGVGMLGVFTRAALACVLLAGWSAAPARAEDTLEKIKQYGTIVVGVKNDYKPWGFVDPSGKIVGMEIDLAEDVAKRLGVKLELIPVTGANRMEFLNQGRIDLILATMGDTPERRKVVGMIER